MFLGHGRSYLIQRKNHEIWWVDIHIIFIYIYIDYIYLRLIPVTPLKSDPWRWSVESGDVFVLQLLGWVFQESRSWNIPWSTSFKDSGSNIEKQEMLLVSTPFNFFFQIGNLPQIGINIKNIWNHHPVDLATPQKSMFFFLEKKRSSLGYTHDTYFGVPLPWLLVASKAWEVG